MAFDAYFLTAVLEEVRVKCIGARIDKIHQPSRDTLILQMLKDERLQISAESKSFLKCEVCGNMIRAGRFCGACEARYHHDVEASLREGATERKKKFISGHSVVTEVAVGEKRFKRDK